MSSQQSRSKRITKRDIFGKPSPATRAKQKRKERRKRKKLRKATKTKSKCSTKSKFIGNKDYMCNPDTGRYVKKDGPTGKRLLGMKLSSKKTRRSGRKEQTKITKKRCSTKSKFKGNKSYVCNPKTGRYVKKDGSTGKKIRALKKKKREKQKKREQKKGKRNPS